VTFARYVLEGVASSNVSTVSVMVSAALLRGGSVYMVSSGLDTVVL
jgi:hypothetical protein